MMIFATILRANNVRICSGVILHYLGRRYAPSLLLNALPWYFEMLIWRDLFPAFSRATQQLYLCAACRSCRSLRRIQLHASHAWAGMWIFFNIWAATNQNLNVFGIIKLVTLEPPKDLVEETYNGHAELPNSLAFHLCKRPSQITL